MCFHLSLSLLRFSSASTSSGLEGGRPLLRGFVFDFLIFFTFSSPVVFVFLSPYWIPLSYCRLTYVSMSVLLSSFKNLFASVRSSSLKFKILWLRFV